MIGVDVRSLSVVLTARCNLACHYCYQDHGTARRIDWATLRQAIGLLLASPGRELRLTFYGGEPLLEFDLLRRAVEQAERDCRPGQRLRFGFSTNGLLLDDARLAFLAEHRVDVQLSFDGVAAAQERRAPDTFARLDALLDRIRAQQPHLHREHVELGLTLTGANLENLADSVDYFLAKDVRTLRLGPRLTHDPDWRRERIHELRRQFARVYRSSLRCYRATGRVPLVLFRKTDPPGWGAEPAPREMCGLGQRDVLAVDVDGRVVGCLLLAESYQRPPAWLGQRLAALRVGALGEPGLAERLRSYSQAVRAEPLFQGKAEKSSSYGRCRSCRWLADCHVCPTSIGHIPGNTDAQRIPELPCAFNRVALGYRARFPLQPSADGGGRGSPR